jgi:hypothetical protein
MKDGVGTALQATTPLRHADKTAVTRAFLVAFVLGQRHSIAVQEAISLPVSGKF